jgi:chemotaxis protein methyltransferase CheR
MTKANDKICIEVGSGFPAQLPPSEAQEFGRLSLIVKELIGINMPMTQKNVALINARIQKLQRVFNRTLTYKEVAHLLESGDNRVVSQIISSLTTNTTQFFRESQHFRILEAILPDMLRAKKSSGQEKEIRIWCAASSTGEEPYSIAITAREALAAYNHTSKILATDIDFQVLSHAMDGIYNIKAISEIPCQLFDRYFTIIEQDKTRKVKVKSHVASQVKFSMVNLIADRLPFKKKFDVIFCRNVLIYFDAETKEKVINSMVEVMRPGGFLFLGLSEGIAGICNDLLKRVGPSVYRKE